MTLEKRIARLEAKMAKLGPTMPGTMIQRVQMDTPLCSKNGIKVPKDYDRESLQVWSLALGAPWMPKQFTYGLTITEAVRNAEKMLKVR